MLPKHDFQQGVSPVVVKMVDLGLVEALKLVVGMEMVNDLGLLEWWESSQSRWENGLKRHM